MEEAEGGGGACWAEVAGRQRAGLLIRAGPCQPTGWGDGPSPGTDWTGSGRAWAGPNWPCFGRANGLRAAWTSITLTHLLLNTSQFLKSSHKRQLISHSLTTKDKEYFSNFTPTIVLRV